MRAALFEAPGTPLVIGAIDDPVPGPGDLILKVKACGICGSDLHMTEPGTLMALPKGAVMGHEFSGEVVGVGSALRGAWREGARVSGFPYLCCGEASPCRNFGFGQSLCAKGTSIGLGQAPGAYAEYVRISANGAHRLPGALSFRDGALVEPLAVGLHAVDMAKMERGATVLVIGAGPVGLAVILWAKFLGARHVIVSEKAPIRRQMAARFGATDAIDPDGALSEQVSKIAGKGPDIIFECVGVPGILNALMLDAPRGAKILVAGVCQKPDTIMPVVGIVKELCLQFVLGYRTGDFDYVIAMLASGRIEAQAMITDLVTLDGLPAAFEALRTPSHQCKVMLEH